MLLPQTDAAKCEAMLARIRAGMATLQPLSLSLGAATTQTPGSGSIAVAVRQADARLYAEKATKQRRPEPMI